MLSRATPAVTSPKKRHTDTTYTKVNILYYIAVIYIAQEALAIIVKGLVIGRSKNPWAGGNGCNLFNNKDRYSCCTAHDKAYKVGGWHFARMKADISLFECIAAQNIFLALLMFVGVRYFGMWAFQYAKPIEVK